MTNPSIRAALLAATALLASCGGQPLPTTVSRPATVAADPPLASQPYFGAQFCEACITASDQPPIQAF